MKAKRKPKAKLDMRIIVTGAITTVWVLVVILSAFTGETRLAAIITPVLTLIVGFLFRGEIRRAANGDDD